MFQYCFGKEHFIVNQENIYNKIMRGRQRQKTMVIKKERQGRNVLKNTMLKVSPGLLS